MMRSAWSSSRRSSVAWKCCCQFQGGTATTTSHSRTRHPPRISVVAWSSASSSLWFSSSSSASTSSSSSSQQRAKVQLSGRPRFYRHVSIVPSAAPWIIDGVTSSTSSVVASPISAGVDGTDSATGVVVVPPDPTQQRRQNVQHHLVKSDDGGSRTITVDEDRRRWLQPRTPDGGEYQVDLVASSPSNTWYAVCLDHKVLQTPARSKLAVPSKALATAIASEWDAQSPTLKPAQMPLTTLSCTVLDQVSYQPQHYQESVLQYVNTDTLRYWFDPTHDPTLFEEQNRLWTPILDRLQMILGREYPTQKADSNVIIYSKNRPHPSSGANRRDREDLMDQCRQWVESLDAWHLGILYSLTVEAKSFGMAMAYLHGGGNNDGIRGSSIKEDHYIASCRVEEEVQIAQWGLVEGGHDYDRLNCSIQVRAAAFVHQCLRHELMLNRTPQ